MKWCPLWCWPQPIFLLPPGERFCRQVTDRDTTGIGLWSEPCWGSPSNRLLHQMPPWSTLQYWGPASKKTGECSGGTTDGLCWAKFDTAYGTGWAPVARVPAGAAFADTSCAATSPSTVALVRAYCDLCVGKPSCPPPDLCHTARTCNPRSGNCDLGHAPTTSGTPCVFGGKPGTCDGAGVCIVTATPQAPYPPQNPWIRCSDQPPVTFNGLSNQFPGVGMWYCARTGDNVACFGSCKAGFVGTSGTSDVHVSCTYTRTAFCESALWQIDSGGCVMGKPMARPLFGGLRTIPSSFADTTFTPNFDQKLAWDNTVFMLGVLAKMSYYDSLDAGAQQLLLDLGVSMAQGSSAPAAQFVTALDVIEIGPGLMFHTQQVWVYATDEDIVVAVRGSQEFADWLLNAAIIGQYIDPLKFIEGLWPGLCRTDSVTEAVIPCPVHRGFLSYAQAIEQKVRDQVLAYAKQKNTRKHIWYTGHSLGGGVAILLAALQGKWCSSPEPGYTEFCNLGLEGVITFEAAVPGDDGFMKFYNQRYGGVTVGIVNENDMVPFIPPQFNQVGSRIDIRVSPPDADPSNLLLKKDFAKSLAYGVCVPMGSWTQYDSELPPASFSGHSMGPVLKILADIFMHQCAKYPEDLSSMSSCESALSGAQPIPSPCPDVKAIFERVP
jgi:hypothetical protein